MINNVISPTVLHYLYIYVAILSIATFIVFGIDKYKAINHTKNQISRISEKTLLLWSFFGGTIGAVLGMVIFRHKIKKGSFLIKFFIVSLIQFEITYLFIKG